MNKERRMFIRKMGDVMEKCNERIYQSLPRKMKDPKSFSILIALGNLQVHNALLYPSLS